MSENFDPGKISYVAAMDGVRDRHPKAMSRATGKVLRRRTGIARPSCSARRSA